MLIDHPDFLATVNNDQCPDCGVYPGQFHDPNCPNRVPIDNDDADHGNGCCGGFGWEEKYKDEV